MKEKGLYEKLRLCRTEEEVKYEFAKFFLYKIDARERIDLYSQEILFEFKYDINMNNVGVRSKAIAQALYYIRRLKYGRDVRVPSVRICIVDKNEALFIETDKLKDYYLASKATRYDWDLAPSNPCKQLVHDLSDCDVVKNAYIYHFNNSESEKEFISKLNLYRTGEQVSLFGNKKEINELNFYEIFEYWQSLFGSYVENGRKSSEYFVTDIEQGRSNVIEGGQVLFRMNSGEIISKYLPIAKYEYFWNTYEKINDRDQLLQPIGEVLSDEIFVSDCVIWSIFSNSNTTASMSEVSYEGKNYRIKNQMFPFLTSDMKKWEVDNADIKTQIWAKHGERYVAEWLDGNNLSEQGKDVLEKAKIVYKYFYKHFNETAWPKYKIYNWDAGWWQIRMALNDEGIAQEELEELYEAHKELGKKILPQIYQYQFVEPDMREVNV